MAIKIYKRGNMVRVEDDSITDSHPPVPGVRTSYYFDPQGSNNVIIKDDFNGDTLYNGLITGITTGLGSTITDKASGEVYLDDNLGG